MKFLLAIALFLASVVPAFSQTDSTVKKKADTLPAQKPKPTNKPVDKPATVDTSVSIATFDSSKYKDSLRLLAIQDSIKKDSLNKIAIQVKAAAEKDTSTYAAIMYHAFMPFGKPPVYLISKEKNFNGNEALFYLLLGIVALTAFIRVMFPKYFQNLFSLISQTSFRQKQTRDQLLQDNLASLLMNLLFIVIGSLFVALVAQQQHWVNLNFWWLLIYCAAILAGIYLVKYLFLLFSGWVFNVKEAMNNYMFIVFLTNKILGIVLLPLLVIVAFSPLPMVQVAITISIFIVGAMFLYRYVVSLGTIRSSLKVNALHFFLYLCAVEVLPLILLYKVLFNLAKYYPNI